MRPDFRNLPAMSWTMNICHGKSQLNARLLEGGSDCQGAHRITWTDRFGCRARCADQVERRAPDYRRDPDRGDPDRRDPGLLDHRDRMSRGTRAGIEPTRGRDAGATRAD